MQWKRTALMLASEGGYLDVVRELLKSQADVNAQERVCNQQQLLLLAIEVHEDESECVSGIFYQTRK